MIPVSQTRFPRLRRLCDALPASRLEEQLASLPAAQRLLAYLLTVAVVLLVPPRLVDEPAVTPVAVALAFLTYVTMQ